MKSAVTRADDPLEREADQAGTEVTEILAGRRGSPRLSTADSGAMIQKACAECHQESVESPELDENGPAGQSKEPSVKESRPLGACESCEQRSAGGLADQNDSEPGQPAVQPESPGPLESETQQAQPDTGPEEAPRETTPSQTPDSAPASGGLVVDDATEPVDPGQMKKSLFLSQLEASIRSAADEGLAGTGKTTQDCPYLGYWFGFYQAQDAARINRAITKYAPESSGAKTAEELISAITQRARLAVQRWAATGQVTGVPQDISLATPGDSAGGGPSGQEAGGAARQSAPLYKAKDGGPREASDPQTIRGQLGNGGPLDGSALARMQGAFGQDFSHVRVHTDSNAAQVTSSLNARAFTIGKDIAFGTGEYQPGTAIGDALLAHELAHVVQQTNGRASTEGSAGGELESQGIEEDADVSAVGAVASLWGRSKASLGNLAQNTSPRLRSGLRLSRCTKPCMPTFKSLTATSSGLFSIGNLSSTSGCDVAFGVSGSPGMTFKSEVDVPANCKGKLEYLQHIDRCDMKRDLSGTTWQLSTNGFALDTKDPMKEQSVTSAGPVTFQDEDSPQFGNTTGNDFLSGSDKFKTWLLWTQDRLFADRTPLAVVNWNWSANASKEHDDGFCQTDWVVKDGVGPSQTGVATSALPPAVSKVYPRDFAYVVGTCSGAKAPPAKPGAPAKPEAPTPEKKK